MIIREAQVKDVESIVNININGWIETYRGIFPDEFLDSLNEKKIKNMENCKSKINEYIVCEIENKVVGFPKFGNNEYKENLYLIDL